MSGLVGFKYDVRRLQWLTNQHGARIVERALNRAVEGTTRKAATQISREIRDTYAVSAGDIRRTLRIQRVRRDATRALLYTGRRLPLEKFSPSTRQIKVTATRKGKSFVTRRRAVSVRIRKDKGRTVVPNAWYAKGRVLQRSDLADPMSQPHMQFGPSIPGMVAHQSVIDSVQEFVREDLPAEFSRRLDYLLQREAGT